MTINKIFVLATTIEELNEKLDNLSAKYLDNPWSGLVIFGVLLIIGCWAISNTSK